MNGRAVQVRLLGPVDVLVGDLPFPLSGLQDRFMLLEIYEAIDPVGSGESWNDLLLVLPYAARKIVGNAYVERAIPAAGKNIDEEQVCHRHCQGSELGLTTVSDLREV